MRGNALPVQADLEAASERKSVNGGNNGFLARAPADSCEAGCWMLGFVGLGRRDFPSALLDEILACAKGFGTSAGDDCYAESGGGAKGLTLVHM